jgi:hypothetical protein
MTVRLECSVAELARIHGVPSQGARSRLAAEHEEHATDRSPQGDVKEEGKQGFHRRGSFRRISRAFGSSVPKSRLP